MSLRSFLDTGRVAAGGVADFVSGLANLTIRLGVTGLSRSGKTVFITALVHALTKGAKLPLFETLIQGRITRAYLEPQPNDDLPRFAYEDHLSALTAENPHWPESTSRISQLRLTLDYEPRGFLARNFGKGKLHIDIVDYPGEWLLDLPLLQMSYRQWSENVLAKAKQSPRLELAHSFHELLAQTNPLGPADEAKARQLAENYTAYLALGRGEQLSLSSLTPGRFLMPGDLAQSPLLTFAPLPLAADQETLKGSLAELMERRYNSYVDKVVRPFFFDHFARLNRQIVLVDVLSSLNAGNLAVQDLRAALEDVLSCFRVGSNNFLNHLFGYKIDRILFAATKADLLHHTSHDRLENILTLLVAEAASRADALGTALDTVAIAAIRATREAQVKQGREEMACIVGTPQPGETIDGVVFDGKSQAAIFPGDLPANSLDAVNGASAGTLKFIRFLPPPLKADGTFPQIRLDRVLAFLAGDKLS